MEGRLQPSPEPSPDDLSSPSPNQAAPLLQAQQRPPSHAEKEDTHPVSASGAGNKDAEIIETGVAKEVIDVESSLPGTDREERTAEKNSEQHRIEDCEDKETADGETADEGLPPSKGSEDESEEESDVQNEPSDATINPLETPQDYQDDFIDVQEPAAQVGLTLQAGLTRYNNTEIDILDIHLDTRDSCLQKCTVTFIAICLLSCLSG